MIIFVDLNESNAVYVGTPAHMEGCRRMGGSPREMLAYDQRTMVVEEPDGEQLVISLPAEKLQLCIAPSHWLPTEPKTCCRCMCGHPKSEHGHMSTRCTVEGCDCRKYQRAEPC